MLIKRVHPDKPSDILYHYCSPDAFLSIIQNKTLRFSDANLLNDSREVHWGYSIFEEAATRFLGRKNIPEKTPEIPRDFFDHVDKIWATWGYHTAHYISCFSHAGDSLNQWRSYADDGRGFAIGFKRSELGRQPILLLDVLYERDVQVHEMMVALLTIFQKFYREREEYDTHEFFTACGLMVASAIALKDPSWRDEKEIRSLHLVDVKISENSWKLTDGGGMVDNIPVSGRDIQYKIQNGTISSFLDIPFEVTSDHQPIHDIVLGPKCRNANGNIKLLLGHYQYLNVEIKSSDIMYR